MWPCLDFRGKDAEHSQSGDDAGCAVSGPDGTKLPRTGHPDPWRARSPGLPRVPRLGSRSYLPGQPSQIGGSRIERGQSAGAVQIIR